MTDVLCGKGALSSGGMTTTGPQGQHHSAEKNISYIITCTTGQMFVNDALVV